jgi:hypothetical protein
MRKHLGLLGIVLAALVAWSCAPSPAATPAAVPTPTAAPAGVPFGWQPYQTLQGKLSFAYPASWSVVSEVGDSVSLRSGTTVVIVQFMEPGNTPRSDEEAMTSLLAAATNSYLNAAGWKDFQITDEGGVWDAGVGRAYYCEVLAYLTQPGAEDTPTAQRLVMLRLGDAQGGAILSLMHYGATDLDDTERNTFKALVGTVRVK